jgi:hypothetical protein
LPDAPPDDLTALRDEKMPAKPRRKAGRPPGSFNKSLITERRIRQHHQARSFLAKVIKGGKIKSAEKTGGKTRVWAFPTLVERLRAAELQLRDSAVVAAVMAAESGTPLGQSLDALDQNQIQNLIVALRAERFKSEPRPVAINAEFQPVDGNITPIREGLRPALAITAQQKDTEPK